MSVYDFEDKKGVGQYWRDEYGIPFQRVGSAVDYAQCIIGLVVVSPWVAVADRRTSTSRARMSSLTARGSLVKVSYRPSGRG
jgi:hypothetical protein